MKEMSLKQNSEDVNIAKKMEYLDSLKLGAKDSLLPFVKVKPKMVTRLLRNRVVLKEIDGGAESETNAPEEISPEADRNREIAEKKILDLTLANNISMDAIMKKVIAFSPIVKIERQTLTPYHSSRASSPRRFEITEKSVDRENSLEKKPYVDTLLKETVTPIEPGLAEVRKKLIKSGTSTDNEEVVSLLEEDSYRERKIKESSPYIELESPEKLFNGDDEVEADEELHSSLESETKISISEDVLPVESTRNYCDFCNVGYTNSFVLEKHKKKCKLNPKNVQTFPRKIFYCRYCYFGITNENYFKLHESRCPNEHKDNKKPKKPLKRASIKELSELKTKRPKLGANKCPHCDYTSNKLGHLNEHVRIHSKVPLCVCEICDKGFNRISSLRIHMFKHLNLAEEISLVESIEICDESAKKIVMQVKLNGRNIEIVKYECNKCEFVTTVLFSLEVHLNSMHLRKQEFKCNICPFTSAVKSNLQKHLNLHTRERTYKCPKCPYETLNNTHLKKHDNQIHTKAKVFQCNSCDFKCYSQVNLKCHVNSMHSKKKKYNCKFCRYFSYYQSNLIGHVKNVHRKLDIGKTA